MTCPQARAIGRSLDIYYRDKARTERMDRLNAQFVPPGGLAFDIGAHLGDRTASFLRLGASVVACEPQPRIFRALRLIHGRNRAVQLRCEAVGAHRSEVALYVNSQNPTVTTASRDFVAAACAAEGWEGQTWDQTIRTPMTTLEHLISDYGLPDFTKIDVEGHELDVLTGLATPLPALSFEFTTIQRDVALACLTRLRDLAPYSVNLSLGEDHALRNTDWITPTEMQQIIRHLPHAANSGDIYARLGGRDG